MPEEAKQDVPSEQPDSASEESKTPEKPTFLGRLIPGKWTMILLGVSIVNFAIGFGCCWLSVERPSTDETVPEIQLGSFQFEADNNEAGPIRAADFALHIALLDHLDQSARQKLQTHQVRIRQGVEELLRHAHSGDFEDPKLAGLKRQLQEQVNQTLGMRVIADVIITDLKLEHGSRSVAQVTETTETLPWVEKQSGLAVTEKTPPDH